MAEAVYVENTKAEARHAKILEEEKSRKEHLVSPAFCSWLPFLPDPKTGGWGLPY